MASPRFIPISDLDEIPINGYFIIGHTLYSIQQQHVDESWDLTGNSPSELVQHARREAGLHGNTRVYYDDAKLFNEDVVDDTGRLITADDAFDELDEEEKDGWSDIAEYYADC